jgi:hypothetical protein
VTKQYTITVGPPCPLDEITFTPGAVHLVVGRPAFVQFATFPFGPIDVILPQPIPGLRTGFEDATVLDGRAQKPGKYEVVVRRRPYRAECPNMEKKYLIEVTCPSPKIFRKDLAPATAGEFYFDVFHVRGELDTQVTIEHADAPDGVLAKVTDSSPTSDGGKAISVHVEGTPTVPGLYYFVVRVQTGECVSLLPVRLDVNGQASGPVKPTLSLPSAVQSAVRADIDFSAPGATEYRFEECTGPEGPCTATTTTSDYVEITKTVATPTPFYFRVTPTNGRSAGMTSEQARMLVLPTPMLESPESAILPDILKPDEIVIAPIAYMGPRVFWARSPIGTLAANVTFSTSVDHPSFTAKVQDDGSITVLPSTADLPSGTTSGTLRITASDGTTSKSAAYPVSVMVAPSVARLPRDLSSRPTAVIPVVAHARGANASEFRSDVRLTNLHSMDVQYRVIFTPSGAVSGAVPTSWIVVRPGQTVALDDVVRNLFGIGPLGDGAGGSLEVRAETPGAPPPFVTSRTFNASTSGTLGQFIPAVSPSAFTTRSVVQSLQQVADSAAYRTNVGFVEGKGERATLAVRIFDGSGNVKATVPVELQPFEHKQLNGFIGANGVKFDDGRIEVEVTSPTGSVTSYASVVDNITNDPLLVSPIVASVDAQSRSVLPGVADLNSGANFHTDMRVYNPNASSTANVTMTYFPQGSGQTGVTKELSVPPKSVRALDDVLPSFFGISNSGGAVLVTSSSTRPVVVTGRTYSRAGSGTYGQFIPAVGAASAAALRGAPLHLTLLEESPAFRTNIGLFEVSGAPAKVRLSTTLPSGAPAAVIEVDLQANEFRQLGRFLTQLGAGDAVYNARVTVEVVSGSGKVGAYASVVDNRTQDPTYVPAQR